MMWLGLAIGAVAGFAAWGKLGLVVAGFLGWLVGLIVQSQRDARRRRSQPRPVTARVDRVQVLEARVAQLEARLARLERGDETASAAATMVAALPEAGEASSGTESPAPIVASAEPALSTPQAALESTPVQGEEPPPARNRFVAWMLGGNAIARVGVVILFLGLAFLLKYAAEHAILSPWMRVAGVAAAGVALLAFGWRVRRGRKAYAIGLQGGGIGILYLTAYAALRLYGLIPVPVAFAAMAAIAVLCGVLAVMQDSLVLAAFGAGGGFLAPILASTGRGDHVALFGYYLLLNAGIVGIALFRSWRVLSLLGALFTFVIGLAWGHRFYTPEFFATTEPFLVAFFLLYVIVAVVHAWREAPSPVPYMDGMLVFGVPVAAFGLQAKMVADTEYGLAISCAVAAAMYFALALAIRARPAMRLLAESFFALGVVFATLAVPYALEVRWASAAWALEGAAVVWIATRQQRRAGAAFGLALQAAAGFMFAWRYGEGPGGIAGLDTTFLGALVLAIAGLVSARLLALERARAIGFTPRVAPFVFVWGFAWWLHAGGHEIHAYLPTDVEVASWLAFYAASALLFSLLASVLGWRHATWPARGLVPVMAWILIVAYKGPGHPFAAWGLPAWALAACAHFATLRRHETDVPAFSHYAHVGGWLVLAAAGAIELRWWADRWTDGNAWTLAALAAVPAAMTLLAASRSMDFRWPITTHARAYREDAMVAMGTAAAAWVVYANAASDGTTAPVPYLPIFNALDLAHLFVGVAAVRAYAALRRTTLVSRDAHAFPVAATGAAFAFIWANGVLLRTLHHWAGIPYELAPMMRSMLVQASLSIFWTVLALTLMVYATRAARRGVWLAGATLMAAVVVKLFVAELRDANGVERIVSFIVVGLLMLAIGYFAPVPPRSAQGGTP
jgi:uncharacterized membrane protein